MKQCPKCKGKAIEIKHNNGAIEVVCTNVDCDYLEEDEAREAITREVE